MNTSAPPTVKRPLKIIGLTCGILCLLRMPTMIQGEDQLAAPPSAGATAQASSENFSWALRPYVVEIQVSFNQSPAFSPSLRETWIRELQTLLTARYGRMWQLSVRNEPAWMPVASLQSISDAAATAEWSPLHADKVLQLLVEMHEGGELTLSGREWDQSSQSLSSLQQRSLPDIRDLPAELSELVSSLFRPLVQIDIADGNRIECLIRAGEFPTPRAADQLIAAGAYLSPFLRFQDKNKQVRKIQSIPWTYLEVLSTDRARAILKLHSAYRSPLPTSRRRVEVMALLVRQPWPSTEVLIYPRGNRQDALVGVRCTLSPLDQPPPATDSPAEQGQPEPQKPLEFTTDRRGIVTLPTIPGQKIQSLQVLSGTAVLARVPVLPGATPTMELETPDDRARLAIEGEVQLLEGELTEIVATREVLITRTNAAMDQKRWADADRFLKDLQRLPTQTQFISRIDAMQLQAVQAARQAKDKVAEARIERLCSSVRESAQKYLAPSRISEFILQINSERSRHEAAPKVNQ